MLHLTAVLYSSQLYGVVSYMFLGAFIDDIYICVCVSFFHEDT